MSLTVRISTSVTIHLEKIGPLINVLLENKQVFWYESVGDVVVLIRLPLA